MLFPREKEIISKVNFIQTSNAIILLATFTIGCCPKELPHSPAISLLRSSPLIFLYNLCTVDRIYISLLEI